MEIKICIICQFVQYMYSLIFLGAENLQINLSSAHPAASFCNEAVQLLYARKSYVRAVRGTCVLSVLAVRTWITRESLEFGEGTLPFPKYGNFP